MVATVEDGRLTQLRPDKDHPLSRGFACPKGIAMTEVQNDPDRVLHPLKRVGGPGEFERVSWEEALDDIAARLRARPSTRTARSRSAGTWATRAPSATATRCGRRASSTASARRTTTPPGSQDVNNRFAASALLYGSPLVVPIPDLKRTRVPPHGRRQPARLARLGAVRAARPRAAQRDRRARRAGGRRRPAPHRDRARLRASAGPPRRGRLAAAFDAAA